MGASSSRIDADSGPVVCGSAICGRTGHLSCGPIAISKTNHNIGAYMCQHPPVLKNNPTLESTILRIALPRRRKRGPTGRRSGRGAVGGGHRPRVRTARRLTARADLGELDV